MMKAVIDRIFPAHVVASTSDRTVDFSLHACETGFTDAQKSFLLRSLGVELPAVASVRQVHGRRVIVVGKNAARDTDVLPEADGLMTREPDVALMIRTADCVPVFMHDPGADAVALIHAGRRGIEQGILTAAVTQMKETWKTDPAALRVYFGPAVHACCYEVEASFRQAFPGDCVQKNGKYYLDLLGASRRQLSDEGVAIGNITDSGVCTCCQDNYFSYRREGEKAGRMVSVMMIKDK